jgi:NAD(P)H-flavin reductase
VKILQRIAFIQAYLRILEDDNKLLFVIDEVGIGTNLIKHYAYSKKGQRVNVTLPFPFN